MTDDKVERVARAIEDARNAYFDCPAPETPERMDLFRAYARAAIAAAEPPKPTDEEADRIANLCDIALQDALGAEARYDGKVFAKSLAGNGYRVVPLAAVAAAEPRWQPIETAPHGVPLLLWNKHNHFVGIWFADWVGGEKPTHWMPLPPPPGADNE